MLEDDFTYVLRKALSGHGFSMSEAAQKAGISEGEAASLLRGSFHIEIVRKLAPVLGLSPSALAAHTSYEPKPLKFPDIHRLDLPFGNGEQVNAWLIKAGGISVIFDAGFQVADIQQQIHKIQGRLPDRVFITHAHRDHIGALENFLAAGLPVHGAELAGTIPMKPGDKVICGPLTVTACELSGHATPSLGFHIEGLKLPVLVTGDALFAGSIGGCPSPQAYNQALANLRRELSGLPDATILLPGHGPATTLGEERTSNPFL